MEEKSCKYCGQISIDGICDCPEAERDQEIQFKQCQIWNSIEEAFEKEQQEIKQLVQILAELVNKLKIEKANIKLNSKENIVINLDTKGNITIKKNYKETKETVI